MTWKTVVSGRDPALRDAFVNAHMLTSMLRFPKGRAPWLTARYSVFKSCNTSRVRH
jgi:hypothetical protein